MKSIWLKWLHMLLVVWYMQIHRILPMRHSISSLQAQRLSSCHMKNSLKSRSVWCWHSVHLMVWQQILLISCLPVRGRITHWHSLMFRCLVNIHAINWRNMKEKESYYLYRKVIWKHSRRVHVTSWASLHMVPIHLRRMMMKVRKVKVMVLPQDRLPTHTWRQTHGAGVLIRSVCVLHWIFSTTVIIARFGV